jgi:hypothetical protein
MLSEAAAVRVTVLLRERMAPSIGAVSVMVGGVVSALGAGWTVRASRCSWLRMAHGDAPFGG